MRTPAMQLTFAIAASVTARLAQGHMCRVSMCYDRGIVRVSCRGRSPHHLYFKPFRTTRRSICGMVISVRLFAIDFARMSSNLGPLNDQSFHARSSPRQGLAFVKPHPF